ncbi:MAG: carboxypeptidase regulatory-like domain-containing protein [Blastocatellia bacterium]
MFAGDNDPSHNLQRLGTLLLSLLLALLFMIPAQAQSTFGALRGTVTDANGSVVSNATVKVTNENQSATREVTTDAQGNYEALNLLAGRYSITIQATGFKQFNQTNLLLDARQILRVDAMMQVGSVGETVTVEGGAAVINTETPTISASFDSQKVLNLPANYRGAGSTSPYRLLAALPGVQSDNGFGFSIQGALPHQTEVSVDGISTVNVRSNGPQRDNFPSAESIGEMKVQAVGNNAEYGQVADITTTSKGGSNQFHGAAFNYHQNAALDAKPLGSPSKPGKVANTFGGTFSGPIFKDRTFFLGAFEAMRFRRSSTVSNTVPTADLRRGVFTSAIRDPLNNNQNFANNTIPDNRIAPAAKKILELYPLPNFNATVGNFRINRAAPIESNQFDVRIDHNLTSKQSIFGRYTWKDIDETSPSSLALPSRTAFEKNRNLVLSHNYTITPSLLNEFRFGRTYRDQGSTLPYDTVAFANSLGLQGLGNLRQDVLPNITFSGITTNLSSNRSKVESSLYQFNNNTTWSRGRHTFKFGVDYRRLGTNDVTSFTSGDDAGVHNFRGIFTGNDFADFLLGLPSSTTIAVVNVDVEGSANHYHFYGQDSFKVNSKLTLEYGLRYELHPPFQDKNFNIGNFDRNVARTGRVIIPSDPQARAITPASFLSAINACPAPASPLGVPCTPALSASEAGFPEGLRFTDKRNFNPRFGFAYRPFDDGKTVVRGGFGIYTMTILGSVFYSLTASTSSDVREFVNSQTATGPAYSWPQTRSGAARASALGTVDFRTANHDKFQDPYSMQWNLTVEREIGWETGLRISYIGMRGVQLPFAPDLNQPQPSTTPFAQRPLTDRPFPNWNIIYSRDTGANSIYNALQVEAQRRLKSGFTFSSAWTWSKNLSDAMGPASPGYSAENGGGRVTNSLNRRGDRGNVGFNRRHRWITTTLYELPFGKGRAFGKDWNPVANAVLGGWQLSGIFLAQTGTFLTPTFASGDPSGTNGPSRGGQRPDLVAGQTGNLSNPTADRWFDRSAFVCPGGTVGQTNQFNCSQVAPIGRFGAAGVGILVGPGAINLSMGLAKNFQITERIGLKFESTFTNLPNHPNLADPGTNVSNASFGVITSARGADAGGNRVGQFAVRLSF